MRSAEIGLLLLVAEAVIIGLAWRARRRSERAQRVRTGLRAEAPEERIAALDRIANRGVSAHASELLELAQQEEDPTVRAAIIDLVARFQWEPVATPAVAALRTWAADELDRMDTAELRPEPAPGPESAVGSDVDAPLVERVEEALGERVTWLYADTEEGSLLVNRPELAHRPDRGTEGGGPWD